MAITPFKWQFFDFDKTTGLPKAGTNFKITKDAGATFLPSASGVNTDANGSAVISVSVAGAYDVYIDGSPSADNQGVTIIPMDTNKILGTDVTANFGSQSVVGYGSGGVSTNTANGTNSLYSNTTGVLNTAVGYKSLYSNTTGGSNTASGTNSLYSNTTGLYNTANGREALRSNTTGDSNTANGISSLYSNTTGYSNTASGTNSLYSNTAGLNNTANGTNSLYYNTTGYSNTAVGTDALRYKQDGTNNTSFFNCSGVGNNSRVSGSNQVQLGDSATTTYVYGTVQNRSDVRDKYDVENSDLGLDFVRKLRPVSYKWDMRDDYLEEKTVAEEIDNPDFDETKKESKKNPKKIIVEHTVLEQKTKDGTKKRKRKHYGLIAQELKKVLDENAIDFGGFQDHSLNGGCDVMSIGYDELIAPLIKAVQELSEEITKLKEKK